MNKKEIKQLQKLGQAMEQVAEVICELHEAVRVAVREGDMSQLSEVIDAIRKKYGLKDR